MATSGSKSVQVTQWDTLKFSWSVTEQSIANNTSTISWKLELISGDSGRIDSSTSKNYSVTVNGTEYSGTNKIDIANNATKILASGYTTIAHNADGTKSFSYSFSQQFSITFSGASIGTKTGSGSGTLNTIPRKSTLSANNGTLGTAQTLTVTKQASSFTHTITYKCGSASGTICDKSTATSVSFTPPLSLATQNTTGTSVSVVLTITTYNGNTSVGSNTKTISCAIPATVKPTVSIKVTDASGYKDTYGGYIQGMSKFNVVVTASGSQGSSIKSYRTTADGKAYTAASFTTSVVVGTGSMNIDATVTDSRGRTSTARTTVTVLAYSQPKITALSVFRCDANGNSSSSGAFLAVTFSSAITSLNGKNNASYLVGYKKTSASSYTTETLTDYAGQHAVSGGVFVFPAESASSYNILFTVSDSFTSTAKTALGSSVKKLWSILSGGLGFAFNKVAELEGVLDIGFKTKFTGGIQNEVLNVSTDLNDVKTPNTYTSINKSGVTYANTPITSGTFVLEVMNAGAEGQVFQRMTTTFKDGKQECFERHFFQNAWGAWSCVYSDTGWVNLTLQDGISVGSESKYLKGRLKNDVLYIKGDVKGISANWKYIAHVPASLMPSTLASATRFGGVYNMTVFCGMNLTSSGQLYASSNSSGAWDSTKDLSVNVAICG